MVLDHKRFDLFDKMIFEKAVMAPPFRPPSNMPNEACFLYVLNGEQQTVSPTDKLKLKGKDAILMKCLEFARLFCFSKTSSIYLQPCSLLMS